MAVPYYDDGTVTIYHGDCFEVVPALNLADVAFVLTDPPYFRVVAEEWDDQWGPDQAAFLEWIGTFVDMVQPALLDRGTLAMFCSPDLSAGVELEIRKRMAVLNHIVWRKPTPGRLGRMDKESMRRFFPTSERMIVAEKSRNPDGDLFRFRDHVNHSVARDVYADVRERLVALRDEAGLTNREVDNALGTVGMAGHYFGASQWSLPTREAWAVISRLMEERGVTPDSYEVLRQQFDARRREFDARRREFDARPIELLSDVWSFDPLIGSFRTGHPTEKPVPLLVHAIETMSRRNDLVLDCFAGSGSTLRAAKDTGRRAIGIELDERWCEVAARRCSQEVLDLEGVTNPSREAAA